MDTATLQWNVKNVVKAQTLLHNEVATKVRYNCERQREGAHSGWLLNFAVGNYVLVTRGRRQASKPKLMSTWTGTWRVVNGDKQHIYGIQNIVSGEIKEVHMGYCADDTLELTSELKEAFHHVFTQDQFEMAGILNTAEAVKGVISTLRWTGLVSRTRRCRESRCREFGKEPLSLSKWSCESWD